MSVKFGNYDWVFQTRQKGLWEQGEKSERQYKIIERVQKELKKLPRKEREIIEMYWTEGLSLNEIAQRQGRETHKMEGLYKQIMCKLRIRLIDFVEDEFSLEISSVRDKCPICDHPKLEQINSMLAKKKPRDTLKKYIKILKDRYGIIIKTPQTIIGHLKYHREVD